MSGPVAAVVFDFDGVLANSEPLHLTAFQRALGEHGCQLPIQDYYEHFLGYNDEDAVGAMSVRYGWTLGPERIEAILAAKMVHTARLLSGPDVMYPSAEACVRSFAARVPLAIASGAKRQEIEFVLRTHGLADAFRVIVASGETPRSKPAPDPYARSLALLREAGALQGNGALAARCVAVEDSHWGIMSAREAGLRCVAVTTSYPAEELTGADLVVADLAELTLDRLGALVENAA